MADRIDPSPANYVFVWENLGPNHLDRVEALAAAVQTGSSVTAIQFFGRSSVYEWDSAGTVTPFKIITLRPERRSKRNLDLIWPLLKTCLRAGKADIFLCHYNEIPITIAAFVLRLLGRRVYAMIESKFDDYPRRLRQDLVKPIVLSPYNGVIAASERARSYLSYLGVPRERIVLGYSSLSVDRIAALSGEPPAPDGTPFAERDFVIVARLVPKKNLGVALEAFALWLAQTDHPRDLHLCGSGPLEEALRAQADRLGITDRVRFHGFVQIDAVSRVLARALCLLLTSIEEQFGLVVIEAQAVGLPVLVTANAGACEGLIEPGVNGFVLDPLNPRSCAALMLAISEDEAVWRRFAIAARDTRYRGDARHFVAGVGELTGRTLSRADGNPVMCGDGDRLH